MLATPHPHCGEEGGGEYISGLVMRTFWPDGVNTPPPKGGGFI
jgi:hypothetical protein